MVVDIFWLVVSGLSFCKNLSLDQENAHEKVEQVLTSIVIFHFHFVSWCKLQIHAVAGSLRHLNAGGKIGNSCIGFFQARKLTIK